MLVGFAEGLGAAKTYAAREHYEIDANRELIGLGAANLAAGLSSGMVVNGSLSKTAVNGSAGARSQVSGLVVAVLTIVTLLFLTGLFEDAARGHARRRRHRGRDRARRLARARRGSTASARAGARRIYGVAARPDFVAALAALLGVLVFDTLPGLFIGIAVSLLLLLYRASRPAHRGARARPGDRRPVGRPRAPPRERADAGRGRAPPRERASSSPTPTPSARQSASTRRGRA